MNPYEQVARIAKAEKIVAALTAGGVTAEQMRTASDDSWALAEQIAKVKPTSAATREMVIEKLDIKIQVREVTECRDVE